MVLPMSTTKHHACSKALAVSHDLLAPTARVEARCFHLPVYICPQEPRHLASGSRRVEPTEIAFAPELGRRRV